MPTLNVTVLNKIATGDRQIIVCDNTDYVVHFDLDSEWDAYDAKTMRILYTDNTYDDVVFTGTDCDLPRIFNAQSIRIGIYAGDLHATAAAVYECKKSVLSDEGQHSDPPEDVYNQIMTAINNGMLRGETGNGIESIVKTATVGNVDTYTITFTDGNQTTYDITNGSVTSVDGQTGDVTLDNKAEIDGAYENMTVGNAEQLVATQYVEDKAPYVFRPSGGSKDIGNREEKTIVGASVVWNQLVDTNTSSVTLQSGHKYYAVIGGTASIGQSDGTAISVTGGTDIFTDLTAMFGTAIADRAYALEQATAGSGVAWLKSYGFFTKPYYAYASSPSLQSVKVSAHETVGFNQWDEEWELGGIDNNGNNTNNTDRIRSKNYIRVLPNTTYYFKAPSNINLRWYDCNKQIISTGTCSNETRVSPTNAAYLRFQWSGGTTYNNDICINLSHSGTRNGEYEAHVKHEYPLDSTKTLKGVLKLDANNNIYAYGDRYHNVGSIDGVFAEVDLGTLNYTRSSYNDINFFLSNDISSSAKGTTHNYICSNYTAVGNGNGVNGLSSDKTFFVYTNGKIYIRDDSYTDAATFKSAMNGVKLIYELATPTTETADPFQSPMIVDDWGTERFVDAAYEAGDRDFEMPVGHITEYPANLRDKVQHLPDLAAADGDYIVRQTGTQMALVPLEQVKELPDAPTTDGTYTLKVTVSDGVATYSWEA